MCVIHRHFPYKFVGVFCQTPSRYLSNLNTISHTILTRYHAEIKDPFCFGELSKYQFDLYNHLNFWNLFTLYQVKIIRLIKSEIAIHLNICAWHERHINNGFSIASLEMWWFFTIPNLHVKAQVYKFSLRITRLAIAKKKQVCSFRGYAPNCYIVFQHIYIYIYICMPVYMYVSIQTVGIFVGSKSWPWFNTNRSF